jgi:hypothetical protein
VIVVTIGARTVAIVTEYFVAPITDDIALPTAITVAHATCVNAVRTPGMPTTPLPAIATNVLGAPLTLDYDLAPVFAVMTPLNIETVNVLQLHDFALRVRSPVVEYLDT